MAIDPNATGKDYSLIIYSKTEIDNINTVETQRIDDALALKVDTSGKGAPSGIATLDPNGVHVVSEIPIADITEAMDDTENTKVMSPERTHYVIDQVVQSQIDAQLAKMIYDTDNTTNFTVESTAYNTVSLLNVDRTAGEYELKANIRYTLNNTNASAYFRFRITDLNGSDDWVVIEKEPVNNTGIIANTYLFTRTHIGGTLTLEVESMKENSSDILIIDTLNIIIERKS